ncbi:hypothetical protein QLH52_12520 [Methylomonas sp. OY6]|uniref:Uncharacterized protein n=1 Tax=Methylomonas defluvii TaxID=3045149 RepID=A0ABU4UG14_9GAMM|nr:hypothetical protein [Methylomonas sp. OY6]MDX8128111.1 hypothetical protein [Methylomonas sp. OY6]
MTKVKTNNRSDLDRLATSLVDEILSMSDEELLAEAKENGEDSKLIAQAGRNILERASMASGKSKLAAAKNAVQAMRLRATSVSNLEPGKARQKLDSILAQHPETRSKLTLAARKGEGLSDEDVRGMLEDLEELGLTVPDSD